MPIAPRRSGLPAALGERKVRGGMPHCAPRAVSALVPLPLVWSMKERLVVTLRGGGFIPFKG